MMRRGVRTGWPRGVSVVIALALLVQAGALAVRGRRYASAGAAPGPGVRR